MDLGRIYCSLCGFLLALHHNGYFLASLLTFWLVVFVEKEPIRGSGPLNSALISVSHCPVNSHLAFSKIINSSSLTLEKCLLLLPRMRTCLNHLAPPFFFLDFGTVVCCFSKVFKNAWIWSYSGSFSLQGFDDSFLIYTTWARSSEFHTSGF